MPSNTDSEIDILNTLIECNFSFENIDEKCTDFIELYKYQREEEEVVVL